jgi:small subunit ribosomal protein S12
MPTLSQLTRANTTRRNHPRRGTRSRALLSCPQKRGMCTKLRIVKPKKPNSAQRKVAKVMLTSTKRRVICYIPGKGHELREFSQVMVRGGRVPDLPGVQYHLMRGKLDFEWRESWVRVHRRSKYGIPRPERSVGVL